ncbi:MAG: protein translocase subunit SecF [Snowella sp.]|nr:MAG: protein translocase subunit SecF [Snowella sp.]
MKINVIKRERLWWASSVFIIAFGLIAMAVSWSIIGTPLKPSLDFIGGTRLQLQLECAVNKSCAEPIDAAKVRSVLDEEGLGSSGIQIVEDYTLSIRAKTLDVGERTKLQQVLTEKIGKFNPETIQIDTVGPTIGKELFTSGLLALILSFFGIAVYLNFRFQADYAFFAIVALFHDILLTVGIFAILGLVAGVEVDSLFLVALLTIIGFSVNDTVVIYDRIRENLEKYPDEPINDVVDDSVNQTLTRSINTTSTTLLPLIAIFFFGGETLKYFALALIIGFVTGAYSSIFISSTLLAWWRNRPNFKKATS